MPVEITVLFNSIYIPEWHDLHVTESYLSLCVLCTAPFNCPNFISFMGQWVFPYSDDKSACFWGSILEIELIFVIYILQSKNSWKHFVCIMWLVGGSLGDNIWCCAGNHVLWKIKTGPLTCEVYDNQISYLSDPYEANITVLILSMGS